MTPFRVHSITTDGISSYLFNTKSLLYLFIQTAYCVSSTSQCAVTWTSLNSLVTYIFVTLFLSLRWTVAIFCREWLLCSVLFSFFFCIFCRYFPLWHKPFKVSFSFNFVFLCAIFIFFCYLSLCSHLHIGLYMFAWARLCVFMLVRSRTCDLASWHWNIDSTSELKADHCHNYCMHIFSLSSCSVRSGSIWISVLLHFIRTLHGPLDVTVEFPGGFRIPLHFGYFSVVHSIWRRPSQNCYLKSTRKKSAWLECNFADLKGAYPTFCFFFLSQIILQSILINIVRCFCYLYFAWVPHCANLASWCKKTVANAPFTSWCYNSEDENK